MRLRSIRVTYQKIDKPIIESLGIETYQRDVVTLPSALLQTALEAKPSSLPNSHSTEGSLHPRFPQQVSSGMPTEEAPISGINSKQQDIPSTQGAKTTPGEDINQQAERLRRALMDYGIAIAGVDVERTQVGPRVIRYWVKLQPPAGRLAEVQRFAVDLARELSSKSIPIIDNIPGEAYIGIDLARENPQNVLFGPALGELPTAQPDKLLIAIRDECH